MPLKWLFAPREHHAPLHPDPLFYSKTLVFFLPHPFSLVCGTGCTVVDINARQTDGKRLIRSGVRREELLAVLYRRYQGEEEN